GPGGLNHRSWYTTTVGILNPINKRGFLGQDVERMRLEIVARYKAYFDLGYDVNGFCQRSKFLLQLHTRDGEEVMAASLLIKMLSGLPGGDHRAGARSRPSRAGVTSLRLGGSVPHRAGGRASAC